MLRVVAHTSAVAAHQYYAEGLKREDYYSEKQEVAGKWFGKAAKMLGLSGDVLPDQFASLVENINPLTGEKLTPRTKAGRRVGYDLNFHAPKSLSVLHALTQDKAVLSAFRQAVADTMTELETLAETRVRKQGAQANRITGNLAWAEFVHFTARPVGGIPDPHLHVHCFTFNATFDQIERRWKAGEFATIKREAHYAEAAFHARLAGSLQTLGYGIQRTKSGWEIEGVPQSVMDKFSRRTAEIERKAEELGIKNAKAKDALGAATREGKRHGMSFSDLLAAWSVRLTEEEKVQISKVCYNKGHSQSRQVTALEAVDFAVEKHFERASVVQRGHLLASALRYGVGKVSPEAIKTAFVKRGFIGSKIGDEHLISTTDVLAEEIALLAFVRGGRNSLERMAGRQKPRFAMHLSAEQRRVAEHILTSRDQVIAVRGVAGAGKTTTMTEACTAIRERGYQIFAFAPSASASRGTQREAGFSDAETVAHLLASTKMQQRIQGQVVWIDEAGLLGVRDLWRIMEIAGPKTRIILTGDAGQHSPVPRGDAFRIMQKFTGLKIATLSEIRRQEPEEYRGAVAALAKGDLKTGFRRLDKLGAFVEIADDAERYLLLAQDYLALGRDGKCPLVVSPTHVECAKVTDAIRSARLEAGQLGPQRQFVQYRNLQWEEAERGVADNYQPGMLVQFHQNARGIKRGSMLRVVGRGAKGEVEMEGPGGRQSLPLAERGKFMVYEERQIMLAAGDRIRITRGSVSENGKRLDNGMEFAVAKFGRKGEIILSNGAALNPSHGHLDYAYCQTSHSSQSKSVRDVLVAQSKNSFVASSREQFYVSASRGKQTIRIYTDDRQLLQEAVGNTSTRMAGVELAGLTEAQLSEFMSSGMGAKQWQEAVQSRHAPDGAVSFQKHVASRRLEGAKEFAQHLAEQRKTQLRQPGEKIEWKGYVEMRRNIAGADGKSRSKGYNTQVGKGQSEHSKGKSLPKTSQHSQAFLKENAQRHEAAKKEATPAKKQASGKGRIERLTNAYRSAAGHFRKLADKVKGSGKTPAAEKKINLGKAEYRPAKQDSSKRAAEHAAKEKAAAIKKSGEGKARKLAEQKSKQAAPRPPVVKK